MNIFVILEHFICLERHMPEKETSARKNLSEKTKLEIFSLDLNFCLEEELSCKYTFN